jgi:hypothetical protein
MRFLQVIAAAGLALPCAGIPAVRAETPVCDHEAGTRYLLWMKGFSRAELSRLEAAFAGFPCHERHNYVPFFREGFYWYETRANADRLRRYLADALMQLNLPGSVMMAGNRITVEKGAEGAR